MNDDISAIARACLRGAEEDTMSFPQIVQKLSAAGFESYAVDFRRASAVYYRADGDSIALPAAGVQAVVAADFDQRAISSAIREAQQLAPGYTYKGFCAKAAAAGCASYFVSFLGRRALYLGRSGETHVEHFPQ